MILRGEFDLITIVASVLSIAGAFFLVRSIILTGSKEIASMSGTYIGSNPHLEGALVQQKADSIVGFILTLLSGVCWLLTAFFSCALQTGQLAGSLTVILAIVIGLFSHFFTKIIFAKMKIQVSAISFAHHVASYLQPHNLSQFDADKLIKDAKKYGLETLLKHNEEAHANLSRIMRFAGANPGADYILELGNKENKKP